MKKYTPLLLLGLAYTLAMVSNAGVFWWGFPPKALQTVVSIVYLLVWLWFLFSCRNNPGLMRFSAVVGGMGAVGAVFALIVRADLHAFAVLPALLLGGTCLSPLYGIFGHFSDFDCFYAAAGTLSLALLCTALLLRKRENR